MMKYTGEGKAQNRILKLNYPETFRPRMQMISKLECLWCRSCQLIFRYIHKKKHLMNQCLFVLTESMFRFLHDQHGRLERDAQWYYYRPYLSLRRRNHRFSPCQDKKVALTILTYLQYTYTISRTDLSNRVWQNARNHFPELKSTLKPCVRF